MFKRYAAPSRRVVFYAREAALHTQSNNINSTHLLSGLLVEKSTRVDKVFQLATHFPEEAARMRALKRFPQPRDIPLSDDGKRIVAGAAAEANRTNEYWIDTDHLMLSILREASSPAAVALNKAGFQFSEACKTVSKTSDPRDDFGPVPQYWRLEKNCYANRKIQSDAVFALRVFPDSLTYRGWLYIFTMNIKASVFQDAASIVFITR